VGWYGPLWSCLRSSPSHMALMWRRHTISGMGLPLMRKRSHVDTRWGDVKRPANQNVPIEVSEVRLVTGELHGAEPRTRWHPSEGLGLVGLDNLCEAPALRNRVA
jgi:hypothetical protein